MTTRDDIVVFALASSGAVEQWDGHVTPTGVLLRWFARPDLGYPELGFDVYRATVPDIAPLPFNDLNAPLVEGLPSWTYAGRVTLSSTAGLHFAPSSQPGWWRLIIAPGDAVTVRFTSAAWLVTVRADVGTSEITVRGSAAGAMVREETLYYPGATLTWRTRGVEELSLAGDGSVSFIGFHLLDDAASWQRIAHRCLPVIDPAYPCGPQPGGTEADEARRRLPGPVAAEWTPRFDAAFAALLPALRRLATGAPPAAIPTATGRPDVKLSGDEQAVIALSSLDPHGARILGLAYDDPLQGVLDRREYVYKVVGRWLGEAMSIDLRAAAIDAAMLEQMYGLEYDAGGFGPRPRPIGLRFRQPVRDFSIELDPQSPIAWTAEDGAGGSQTGTATAPSVLTFDELVELQISPGRRAQPDLIVVVSWTPSVERVGLMPGVVATEPGPPPGPATLTATVALAEAPSAIATADLDWPVTIGVDDTIPEGEPIWYQIGHRRLAADPDAAAPVPTAPERRDLLRGGSLVLVSAARARQPMGQRALHTDRNEGAGLGGGWWGWWIRGVDLFGRVSAPSTWALATVHDVAPPPAPIMVQAEWVQRDLPAATVAALGRSTEAKRWLAGSVADAGLVASWAFGPDQADLRPDVDGFELLVRRASLPAGAPNDAALQYQDPWPAPIASYGPMAIRAEGAVTAVPSIGPVLAVNVGSVQALAAAPNAKPTDPVRSACATDLELDGAAGVFVGGTLKIGTTSFPIVASGDGPGLTVVVQHLAGTTPVAGAAQLQGTAGSLVAVSTNVPALSPPNGVRARSGVLVSSGGERLQVLRVSGGTFLCRVQGALAAGDAVTWFPVWSASLDDAGFGPVTSSTAPVRHAQVAVRAVRDVTAAAIASTPSVPLTVTAVDLTWPVTPAVNAIAFGPADTCAPLASRADWYGRSRFRFSWAAQVDRRFTVYRALGDEIARLDRLEYLKGGRRAQNFPQAGDWPAGVYADAARRTRVTAELAAITAAHAVADAAPRAEALDAAYAALTIDTQMLLARQGYAWPAFAAVHGEPITTSAYEDTLDGRAHGHWFYRVTSRTPSGLDSAPSEPTPPICCPDVVPPAVPLAHVALAADGAVKLRWLASPDADLDHYDIYAAREPEAAAELATMTPVAVYAPAQTVGGVMIEQSIARAPGKWCFWIVAADRSGNRSAPSAMLRGRSLRPPPDPPVWVAATRAPAGAPDHIALSWSHARDQRLACLVERRPGDGGFWASVSGWLPRGTYQYDDRPSDLNAAWEYRLRVRDHLGQVASVLPTIMVQAP